jgi:HAE1 family hydrophobic/amphiphilic exporter-1
VNLVSAFVRNPVKVAVGVLLVGLFGGIAWSMLPVQLVPEVQQPALTIETWWPGASPQEVEREIVQEQEEQLKGVEGVTKMSSECMDTRAVVSLEFAVGTDMASALLKVNTRLQQVREYPEDALEPVISTSSASDNEIAWFILRPRVPSTEEIEAFQAEHPELAEALEPARKASSLGLRGRRLEAAVEKHPGLEPLLPPAVEVVNFQRFAEDTIESRLERVEGVSGATVLGGREDEIQVIVDPRRLAARKITIPQLRLALATRNRDVSAGDYWEGKRRYVVRTLGQFVDPSDVADAVVARRDGVPVYVRDVAEVKLGYKKPLGSVYSLGRLCMAVNAKRSTGANVIEVMEGIKEGVKELNDGVLKDVGLQLEQVYDETEYIDSAVGLVKQNILLGGILTFLVLLLFLRSVRSTIVVSLAIPTSAVGTLMLLWLFGRSLNVVSLAGMAFAVGMLVDNAVVVLENIYRHYQMGEKRFEAAVKGTAEVWGAVVASTLTTLAVFIPILFLKDEVGQLFGDIAVAISCAVALSLIVSVTVIPTATARILSKRKAGEEPEKRENADIDVNASVPSFLRPVVAPFDLLAKGFVAGVMGAHRWLERGVLRQLALVGALVVGVGFLVLILWPRIEYLPSGNQNMAFAVVLPPPGYNLDEMSDLGARIDERLQPYWNTDPDTPEAEKLGFTTIRSNFFVAYGRQVFMGASAHDPLEARKLVGLLQKSIRDLPGTYAFAQQANLFSRGLSASRSIDIEIQGPDVRKLVQIGGGIMQQVDGRAPNSLFPGGQARPIPGLDLTNPEVHVVPKWDRMADVGVTAADLGYTVNSFVDGAYAGDYIAGGDKIDLTIIGEEKYASRLQDLKDLPIATPSGSLIPLGAVADIELSSGPEQIDRRERERTVTIQVQPPPGQPLEEAVEIVKTKVVAPLREQGVIGGEYRITLGGAADKLIATLKRLGTSLLLAVIITYLLMAALFESWIYPFVVILSVPLGAVGGLVGLMVLNLFVDQSLDTLTMIGFIILIGTVVNNAILIVHQSLNYIRGEGREVLESVRTSVRTRMRPIFMTLFTTTFGLSPLVLFPGAGSELYRGIGSILIGGLVISTVFTLFLVPTLLRLLLGAKGVYLRWRDGLAT